MVINKQLKVIASSFVMLIVVRHIRFMVTYCISMVTFVLIDIAPIKEVTNLIVVGIILGIILTVEGMVIVVNQI